MSWFKSYDKEYRELLSHLTGKPGMKPLYARAFLDAYKRSIGNMLSKGKRRSSQLLESPDPEESCSRWRTWMTTSLPSPGKRTMRT